MFLVVPAEIGERETFVTANAARDEPPRTKPVDEVFRSERRRLSLSSSLSSLTLSSLSSLALVSVDAKSLPNLLFCGAGLSNSRTPTAPTVPRARRPSPR